MSDKIKARIQSLSSTRQITRAMEMVAAAKLQRAQVQAISARPYFRALSDTIHHIASNNHDVSSPYLLERPATRVLYIVIAGDRGLAGGYNSNILKLAQSLMQGRDAVVLPIGKKAADFFRTRRIPVYTESHVQAGDLDIGSCFSTAGQLCNAFLAGEFHEVHIFYTKFISALTQAPVTRKLLPLPREETDGKHGIRCDTVYEPGPEEALEAIIPEYLGGMLYGALCEARAAEAAARRSAMNAATRNADEMIETLSLQFNRARQAAITREITEIVAGS